MTDAELDAMIADLRSPDTELFDVADAILALRAERDEQSAAADMIAKERDAWEKRAKEMSECLNCATLRQRIAAIEVALKIKSQTLQRLYAQYTELAADNAFLHKRRGELVIERDRYKAALGEYPDGRDVILAGTLAALEKAEADNAALRQDAERYRWLRGEAGKMEPKALVMFRINEEWFNVWGRTIS